MDSDALKKLAQAVISTEAAAVTSLASRIDESFIAACQLIIDCLDLGIIKILLVKVIRLNSYQLL